MRITRFVPLPFLTLLFMYSNAFGQHVKVQIEGSKVIHTVNRLLYGINTARWDESLFPEPTNEMLVTCDRDAIAKIKASGVTMLKYPGGNDADHYIWNSPDNSASEMDTDEYLALCSEVGAEPFITVNFNEPPELAAEWVRYCNKLRGYHVKYWEVGDEQWGSWAKGHSTPEEYARKYTSFVQVMKAVDPTIKVATNVALTGGSPSLGSKSEGWTSRVLKAAGDYVDMLTITFYPQQWGKENDDTLLASTAIYRLLFLRLHSDVERILGKERAGKILYINVGYNTVNHSAGPQTLQVVNALWVADMIGTMAEIGTDIACYWAVHNFYPPRGGDFGYLSSDGSNTPRYSYHVFPLFTRHFGDDVLAVHSNDPSVVVYAGKSSKALSVFIINKSKTQEKKIDISLKDFIPQQRAHLFVLDENRKNERLPDIISAAESFSLSVSPYSLTALEMIARDSVIPPENMAVFATASASSYSTIGPNFKPRSAVDGKSHSAWNSAAWTKSNGEEQQWFQLAWERPVRFSMVRIRWGATFAKRYQLEISDDGRQWTAITTITDGHGGTEEFTFPPTNALFVRMNGQLGTKGITAYSIREFEVYDTSQ